MIKLKSISLNLQMSLSTCEQILLLVVVYRFALSLYQDVFRVIALILEISWNFKSNVRGKFEYIPIKLDKTAEFLKFFQNFQKKSFFKVF